MTAGSMKTDEMRRTNPFDRTVMFSMSPRTYDQTLKGAPKEFLGAQETDMGTYDRNKFGRSVPRGWDNQPKISSRAELMAQRRRDKIPDSTFDLDGDGCVSKEDYTISLRNDKDKDGRLNTAERKVALAELEAGRPAAKFEKLRPITAPEFVRLDSTGWPQRNLPKEVPPTRTALLETRRKELVTKNHKGYLKYEDAMSKVQPAWKSSEEYQLCQTKAAETMPPKKTRSVEMEALKQTKRKDAGLSATMHTLNPDRVALDPAAHISGVVWYEDPAQGALMGYRENPQHFTRSSLQNDRRTTMLDNLEESVRRVGPTFKNMRMRLEDRENSEFLAAKIALSDPSNRVRSDLTQTRREDNVNQLVGMWGNDPEPPMNDAVCVHVCAFVCVLCVCVCVCVVCICERARLLGERKKERAEHSCACAQCMTLFAQRECSRGEKRGETRGRDGRTDRDRHKRRERERERESERASEREEREGSRDTRTETNTESLQGRQATSENGF